MIELFGDHTLVESVASDRIDKIRASILAEVIQREYLEQLVEEARVSKRRPTAQGAPIYYLNSTSTVISQWENT